MSSKNHNFTKAGNETLKKFLTKTSENEGATEPTPPTATKEGLQAEPIGLADMKDKISSEDSTPQPQPTPPAEPTKEIKSHRYNLWLKPSIVEDIKKIAYIQRISLNELINQICFEHSLKDENKAKIEKYNALGL